MPPKKKAKAAAKAAALDAVPPQFAVGLVLGAAGGARDRWLRETFGARPAGAGETFGADEPVVSALARLERGTPEERAERATTRLAACGMNSVPSWMRPYACLSNGEAARVDVAAALARHEHSTRRHCVVDDFACVVNRDAARSMACAVGKYARRMGRRNLVLATAHEDVCAYLQPDWVYDVAAGTLWARPTRDAAPPDITFECSWPRGEWQTPAAKERRDLRNLDLVRELTSSYELEPEAIEKVVLGDKALPPPIETKVQMDDAAKCASQAFDFDFDGSATFAPPDFPAEALRARWGVGVVHGPSGSGKTTVLRSLFAGVRGGKVATREPDWPSSAAPLARLFSDKFGAADGAARLDACALDAAERRQKLADLSACARARAQAAWLLADGAVLDEFTSLAPRPVARRVAAGVAAYVRAKGLRSVVCATVHEDVVAALRPRWLFATAVVTSCWTPKEKVAGFEPTGDARYGCLALLHETAAAPAAAAPAAAAADRRAALFEAPAVTLQLTRCPYYHFETFKKHHYLSEAIQKGAWCWELTWHGRPIGFHAVIGHFGLPGAGKGSTGASREHRVVVLPDFQGIGLGWRLSEVVAARYVASGRRVMSITMHPTFGRGRDRSERWRPKPRNHIADKDEATLNATKRKAEQTSGTWAPTTRTRLRPSYRHEYVGDPGAERDAFLAAASRNVPAHKCKDKGCGHCESNFSALKKILALDKLRRLELEGTIWDLDRPRPALAAPRPAVVDVSNRREPRERTRRLEAVEVVGGLGPARPQQASPAKKKKAKEAEAAEEAPPVEDWTFDAASKKWTPSADDAADFRTTGESIGVGIRSDVDGFALDGQVIGVGKVEDADGVAKTSYRVVYEDGEQGDLWEDEFDRAARARLRWERMETAAEKGVAARSGQSLKVGARVEARWKGGAIWFAGVVKRAAAGAYDVTYDDGETEAGVPAAAVRPESRPERSTPVRRGPEPPKRGKRGRRSRAADDDDDDADDEVFNAGDRVEARWNRGARWWPGSVVFVGAGANGGAAYNVEYDDGDQELGMEARYIRRADDLPKPDARENYEEEEDEEESEDEAPAPKRKRSPAKPPPPKAAKPRFLPPAERPEFEEEDKVDAYFGGWFTGVVDEVLRDAAGNIRGYEIRWANGDCNRISAGKVRTRQRGTAKG